MALIAALVSSVLFGAADFAGGLASRRVAVQTVVVVSQVAGLATVVVAAAAVGASEVGPADVVWGGLAGLSGMIGLLFFYTGLAAGRVSIVSPLAGLTGVAVPVLFGLLVGERPTPGAATGVLLALPAIYLIGTPSTDGHPNALWRGGSLYGLVGGVGFGGFLVMISLPAPTSGLWPLVGARAASVCALGAILIAKDSFDPPTRSYLALIIATGVGDIVANVAFVIAARSTLLVLASVISSLYPAWTLLLARVVLSERTTILQRVGLGIGAAAVVAIAIG